MFVVFKNPTERHHSFVVAKRGVWTCSVCKNGKGRPPPNFDRPCGCIRAVIEELELPEGAKPELVGKGAADAKARSMFPSPIASLQRKAVPGCVLLGLEGAARATSGRCAAVLNVLTS